jgi:putative DNA primase/helicase
MTDNGHLDKFLKKSLDDIIDNAKTKSIQKSKNSEETEIALPDTSDEAIKTKKTSHEKFLPALFGDLLIKKQPTITDQNTDLIFIYNKDYGYYDCVNSIPLLKMEIQNILGASASTYKVQEVINYIKRKTYRNIQRFDPTSEYVCLNNGILNLRTMKMEPHDPGRFISYRIPVDVTDVDDEPWLHYIESVVHTDDQLKLQESIGNIFANHYETKKLTYLYGGNDSGKSTFLNIIKDFLSENNTCHLTLTQLNEKFTNAQIYGKRANIYADVPYKIKHRNFGLIKNFTGGDPVTLQFKGRDAFNYRSIAKQFFSANGIPLIDENEADDAFYRRWEFIRFPHAFPPDESVFKTYTTPEMKSAILLWALQGYQRLKENHWKLTNQTTIEEAKEKFEGVVVEPSGVWLLERCNPESTAVETKKTCFEDCKEWHCKKCLPFVDNYDVFCKWMHNQRIIPVLNYRPIIGEEREPSFVGIRLKPKN